MADMILGQRFFGYSGEGRGIAWHAKGTYFETRQTATKAAEVVGLADIRIEKRPVEVMVNIDGDNYQRIVDDEKFALVRYPVADDNRHRVLAYVSDSYTFLPYTQLVNAIDPLTEKWGVETMGILEKGRAFFMTLDAGTYVLRGKRGKGEDQLALFFSLTDRLDGTSGMNMLFSPIRIVCRNTEIMAKKYARVLLNLNHSRTLEHDIQFRVKLLEEMQKTQDRSLEAFEKLAVQALAPADATAVFEAAYAYPPKPRKAESAENVAETDVELTQLAGYKAAKHAEQHWNYLKGQADDLRAAAGTLYEKWNDENPAFAKTAWGAYNVVTELESHRESRSDAADTAESILFGARAMTMQRAFDKAMSFVPQASKFSRN